MSQLRLSAQFFFSPLSLRVVTENGTESSPVQPTHRRGKVIPSKKHFRCGRRQSRRTHPLCRCIINHPKTPTLINSNRHAAAPRSIPAQSLTRVFSAQIKKAERQLFQPVPFSNPTAHLRRRTRSAIFKDNLPAKTCCPRLLKSTCPLIRRMRMAFCSSEAAGQKPESMRILF